MSLKQAKISDYGKAKRCMSTFLLSKVEQLEAVAKRLNVELNLSATKYLMLKLFKRENPTWPNVYASEYDAKKDFPNLWPTIELKRFSEWLDMTETNPEASKEVFEKLQKRIDSREFKV